MRKFSSLRTALVVALTAFTVASLASPLAASAGGAPSNDDIADAVQITRASGGITGTTTGATFETNEWKYRIGAGPSVWYEWVAPATKWVSFDTCSPTDEWFDTVVAVFTFTTVGDWSGGWTDVGHNDDACDGNRSVVAIAVRQGTTYYIQVSGYHDYDIGPFKLTWRMGRTRDAVFAFLPSPPPPCDPTLDPRDPRRGCPPNRGRR